MAHSPDAHPSRIPHETEPRLLLIEDNRDHARAIELMVGDLQPGSTLLRAESLDHATTILRERRPPLILLDLHLPDAHGLELVGQVRALAPHAAIVVLTALDDESLATDAVTAGAQDFLVKGSFDAKGLTRALRHALARHQRLTELERARLLEAERATHDALTGLPNRALLLDRLNHAIERCARSGTRFAVAFVDLDDFKIVNDVHGHAAGDSVLCYVADYLRANVRGSDTVARLGGDEFVMLFESVPDRETARTVLDTLGARFAEPIDIDRRAIPLSISAGIAIYPDDGDQPHALLQSADRAMYVAKAATKSRGI